MLAHTLQIIKFVAAAVFLRDNVVNINVALVKFFTAFRAGVPAVVRLVRCKPFFSIIHKITTLKFFQDYKKKFSARQVFNFT